MGATTCPACGHENIPGDELCKECGAELASLSAPTASSPMESGIMSDPLTTLATRDPVIVPADARVRDVVATMAQQRRGCALVVEAERLVGIITDRDMLYRIGERFEELADHPVAEFMTRDPESLPGDAAVAFALNHMAVGNYRHVPVVDGERLTGLISVRDVLGYLSN